MISGVCGTEKGNIINSQLGQVLRFIGGGRDQVRDGAQEAGH